MIESAAFLTVDWSKPPKVLPGGCAFYRCYLPASSIDVKCWLGAPAWDGQGGFGVMEGPKRAMFGFDVAVLKLLMHASVPHQIDISKKLGQKVIIDIDDFHEDLHEANMAFETTDPSKNRAVNREHYRKAILRADRLTVATQGMFDYYSELHPDVRLIRNGVKWDVFTIRRQQRKPVFGWIGGIPWRSGDLETLTDWLPGFLDDHDLRFHHSGQEFDQVQMVRDVLGFGGTGKEFRTFSGLSGVDPARVTTSPLVLIDEYPQQFTFDVGLVPMSDHRFNTVGKSFVKGLEYAAAGVPFIAADHPEYRVLAEQGIGRIARTPGEWRDHAEQLLDRKVREAEAKRQLKLVRQLHGMDSRAAAWKSALTEW